MPEFAPLYVRYSLKLITISRMLDVENYAFFLDAFFNTAFQNCEFAATSAAASALALSIKLAEWRHISIALSSDAVVPS